MMCKNNEKVRKTSVPGFTLIELLVVIAIISLLVSILLPSLSKAKWLANNVKCMSNLKSINMCWALYFNEENERLPNLQHWFAWGGDDGYWLKSKGLYEKSTRVLYPYTEGQYAMFKCPMVPALNNYPYALYGNDYAWNCYYLGRPAKDFGHETTHLSNITDLSTTKFFGDFGLYPGVGGECCHDPEKQMNCVVFLDGHVNYQELESDYYLDVWIPAEFE